jgi:hypothetical protein
MTRCLHCLPPLCHPLALHSTCLAI